jgi:hypothetical protein
MGLYDSKHGEMIYRDLKHVVRYLSNFVYDPPDIDNDNEQLAIAYGTSCRELGVPLEPLFTEFSVFVQLDPFPHEAVATFTNRCFRTWQASKAWLTQLMALTRSAYETGQ